MPGEASLDRLLEPSLIDNSKKDFGNILGFLVESFSNSKRDDLTYLTHEKNCLFISIFEKLLDQLSSCILNKATLNLNISSFSMAFSINKLHFPTVIFKCFV